MRKMEIRDKLIAIVYLVIFVYLLLVLVSYNNDRRYKELTKKLDSIASQTDATTDKLENIESDFKDYRTEIDEIIDSICE